MKAVDGFVPSVYFVKRTKQYMMKVPVLHTKNYSSVDGVNFSGCTMGHDQRSNISLCRKNIEVLKLLVHHSTVVSMLARQKAQYA